MADVQQLDTVVARMRDGDRDAVGEIYRVLAPGLRAWLRTQVRHGEVADDLTEQTFVELVTATDAEFEDGAAVRAWLFRAARNNLIDWRRRAERRADHELPPTLYDTQLDPGPTPEQHVLHQDAVAEVLEAMDELSEDQQEVLQLRLLGELSGHEVAELTDRNPGAVRALQHRGLRSLARVLEQRRSADEHDP